MIKEITDKFDKYTRKKYVIFFCDECELLIHAVTLFQQLHPELEVLTSSSADHILSQIIKKLPVMILVYLSRSEKDYMSFVKDIRKNIVSATIPILVYHTLPEEEELRIIFKTLINPIPNP